MTFSITDTFSELLNSTSSAKLYKKIMFKLKKSIHTFWSRSNYCWAKVDFVDTVILFVRISISALLTFLTYS